MEVCIERTNGGFRNQSSHTNSLSFSLEPSRPMRGVTLYVYRFVYIYYINIILLKLHYSCIRSHHRKKKQR